MEYKLFCDSTCDLTMELAEKLNIEIIPMQFTLDEKNYNHYLDGRELSFSDFYKALKNGADAKTAQVQFETFNKYFEPVLKEGKDIIYICFTSGMSGTYNTCNIAVEELREKYPDRKITVIDSLCASAGEGYLAYLAGLKMQENPTYDELCTYIEDTKMRIIHWFVVDDLDQLKKGGRIGTLSATFGKALQIKPLISVDNEGKLVAVAKIRGASKVYSTIVDRIKRDGENLSEQTIFVAHAECPEKAEALKELLLPMVKDVCIMEIGPIIGSHVGQGMCAALAMGKRNLT
ncbi:MAG: DegV family protein [Oscillospiraceae bacterium]|nr:DegV family protein [Oscillospiraceae bacterium]